MHTIEDEKNIKEYEKYILRNGIDRSVIDAYCEASKIILCGRKDREYGLKVSTRAKELIFEYIKSITNGDIQALKKLILDDPVFSLETKEIQTRRYGSRPSGFDVHL